MRRKNGTHTLPQCSDDVCCSLCRQHLQQRPLRWKAETNCVTTAGYAQRSQRALGLFANGPFAVGCNGKKIARKLHKSSMELPWNFHGSCWNLQLFFLQLLCNLAEASQSRPYLAQNVTVACRGRNCKRRQTKKLPTPVRVARTAVGKRAQHMGRKEQAAHSLTS